MKFIRIIAAVLFVVLLAAYCASRRDGSLEGQARTMGKARGLAVSESKVVSGVRERAVCGLASGRRFVARDQALHPAPKAFVVEGDLPPAEFEALHRSWCD